MKLKIYFRWGLFLMASCISASCEDFVEIDAPEDKLVREVVFESDETAQSAMTGIYNELFRTAFSNGGRSSVTVLTSLSSDMVRNLAATNLTMMEFEQNELLPDNSSNTEIWASAYNVIYMANSLLEGLESSEGVDPDLKSHLEGEAKFIRAFCYFYLTNLYGDVPLVLTSNYRSNEAAARETQDLVYAQILVDLHSAVELLDLQYRGGQRTNVNSGAAMALLARVYLYMEDWEMAENFSTQVLNETSTYTILGDLNSVFKANSREALWQISPIGSGGPATQTEDGSYFIIDPVYSNFASVRLDEAFVSDFDNTDLRLANWIGFFSEMNAYFPYKYKIWVSSEQPIEEYSMVLRFAEQYLIRAEARAQLGDISGAIADLDMIRNRAGIDLISDINPEISKDDLLLEIYQERKKELFTEWGHRWFDLKRTGRASEVLAVSKSFWQDTNVLYPIPEDERIKNSNLSQNPGY